jgi:hypothetical protein
MNRDYVEMLAELSGAGVEYLVIGRGDLIATKRAAGRTQALVQLPGNR